jgi:endonuclease/exonuclease/phosphatase family metal-dependent hydrolase
VRLVSLNAWGVPTAEALAERLAALPAALLGFEPDVICLQEIWMPKQREDLALALGEKWHMAEPRRGGLLLASRFPIREATFTPFAATEGLSFVERIAGKGWLDAVVEAPWGGLRVVTTHLAHQGPREAQLAELLAALEARRDLPLVLAGDFNLHGDATAMLRAVEQGLLDTHPPTEGPEGSLTDGPPSRVGWPRPVGPARGGWRPDRIFVRDLRCLEEGMGLDTHETALSDHNLLWAVVERVR